eukprot:8526743-Pyramimonas_sp.AAC.1
MRPSDGRLRCVHLERHPVDHGPVDEEIVQRRGRRRLHASRPPWIHASGVGQWGPVVLQQLLRGQIEVAADHPG